MGCAKPFFMPLSLEALGGSKGQILSISITKSISKIFIPNCVSFSQMKAIKHIEWDVCSVAWVLHYGSDLGG